MKKGLGESWCLGGLVAKTKIRKSLICILSIFIFTCYSCDYSIKRNGRVLSSLDGKPISGAKISLKDKNITITTDSLGYFNLEVVGGRKPPKPIFIISKEGYKNFEIEFDATNSENVFKVKTEKKNYNLNGKFFYPDSTNLLTFFTSIEFEKYSKDFAIKNDSLIIYLDIDDLEIDFGNYLKKLKINGWDIDRYKVR